MSLVVTEENASEIIGKTGVVILDFWAEWCGPCRMYGPIVDSFAEENPDITVAKVNVDENRELAASNGIRSIPTTIIYKDGQVITKLTGVQSKDKLAELIEPLSV
jgi:thioredoxin 1